MPTRTHAPECAKTRALQAARGRRSTRDQSGATEPDHECTCSAEYEAGALSAEETATLRADNVRLRSAVAAALVHLADFASVTSGSMKAERLLEDALCQGGDEA